MFEIRYKGDKPPTNSQILSILHEQYPDKTFSIGDGGTIVESYRFQPELKKPVIRREEVVARTGSLAVAEASIPDDYLGRVMSNDL